MRQPRHVRLPNLDDAARAELGPRVIWALGEENALLHWIGHRDAALAIVDAFDRHTAVTRRVGAGQ